MVCPASHPPPKRLLRRHCSNPASSRQGMSTNEPKKQPQYTKLLFLQYKLSPPNNKLTRQIRQISEGYWVRTNYLFCRRFGLRGSSVFAMPGWANTTWAPLLHINPWPGMVLNSTGTHEPCCWCHSQLNSCRSCQGMPHALQHESLSHTHMSLHGQVILIQEIL